MYNVPKEYLPLLLDSFPKMENPNQWAWTLYYSREKLTLSNQQKKKSLTLPQHTT